MASPRISFVCDLECGGARLSRASDHVIDGLERDSWILAADILQDGIELLTARYNAVMERRDQDFIRRFQPSNVIEFKPREGVK